MRIGILSDSHGRHVTTRTAVSMLVDRGAELLLHLGDIGTEAVLDELVGHNARIVLGNCDWPYDDLQRYARCVRIPCDHPMGTLTVDARTIAYTHGDDVRLMSQAMSDGAHYLLSGHTHVLSDERRNGIRLINPGALFRASRYTVALLDPGADHLEYINIER